MSKLAELLDGCPTQVVNDDEVAAALAQDFAQKYRPGYANEALAKEHISQFLANNTSMCLSRGTLKDGAVVEIIFAATAQHKGWVKL